MRFSSLVAVGAAAVASWSGHASAVLMREEAPDGSASAALAKQEQLPKRHRHRHAALPAGFPNISRAGPVDISRAKHCLRLTTPGLPLEYPADAEEHVEEIRRAMRQWKYGSAGTRNVEDIWNNDFADMWFHRPDKSKRLSHFFGPYVPIFADFLVPWLVGNHHYYPEGFVTALRSVLRRNVPYVVVSQNAEGLVGKGEFRMSEFPNVLVLSAGGYGHVALPLMKTQGKSSAEAGEAFDRTIKKQAERKPVGGREYFVSFTGSLNHSPHNMRRDVKKMVEDFAESEDLHGRKVGFFYWKDTQDKVWEPVMFNSRFSLVPRGYGRTAFHLVEAIHRGLIPVYIYLDQPWLPYPNLSKSYCYSTHISGLPRLLKELNSMTDDEVMARESAIAAMARTHFTQAAIIRQMKAFLIDRTTDLVCQKLPESVTDMGMTNWAGVGAE
eukprot:CAMPEP_0171230766 /NCGR_PEP_ID=MMETSP0790-20130122/39564_1 /TAXON_ID=2925 /ORGANISM="Alexandrium catenella, Strain OF101" /LENGTH=439 /DNA_ID=CAMNT_0011696985 /DNA_START=84 /DNA_END=1403 /DNA_ORIENTATION=+